MHCQVFCPRGPFRSARLYSSDPRKFRSSTLPSLEWNPKHHWRQFSRKTATFVAVTLHAQKPISTVEWRKRKAELENKFLSCIEIDLNLLFPVLVAFIIWGRCYDHNFLRFLPIFGEKMAFFSKTNVMIKNYHNLALFWVKNANFFAISFRRKYFKSHNIGPWLSRNEMASPRDMSVYFAP
jgi:hypothetical protein